jgi:NADH-quinone oxidoreductase subunit L
MDLSFLLPKILGAAVLLPLASFFIILFGAKFLEKSAAWVAICAIGGASALSFFAFLLWLSAEGHWPIAIHHGAHAAAHEESEHPAHGEHPAGHEQGATNAGLATQFVAYAPEQSGAATESSAVDHANSPSAAEHSEHAAAGPSHTGEYWLLGQFGDMRITISYYIDALTIGMFCMVTFIATCIHFYAMGYMADELHEVHDHEVHLSNGQDLKRPGRFPRFFQYLSLFCFSMLGLVLAGNIMMVFCFWELVGLCSYFLIGFYIERESAATAANKAFIVNRIGDFGMIIGLMALWASLGTFAFGEVDSDGDGHTEPGIFSLVRPGPSHELMIPDGMVELGARDKVAAIVRDHAATDVGLESAQSEVSAQLESWRSDGYGYWLLVVAGIGIFCGCVGKSAQFPLHVWLPDAMEGPTPVSALVHSATMVAAGVYLVGRFFPVFVPEVLLVIAIIGCITLVMAATVALTANDIKRVLAYSTISQLGYMMLALGVGGWAAGLMHLITHAFFKSLLFMCSGSVIHAVHTNDMRRMGGLFRKMPVTAITMLVGCLAISGVGVPFIIGFSGYYSKDAILEQALSFASTNDSAAGMVFFVVAAGGAALTAFYMFRLWFLTFVGTPRDQEAYDHAHESPPAMYLPLVILSIFAVSIAWEFRLLGFGLIAAAFFLLLGLQKGWFRGAKSSGHVDHSDDAHVFDTHHHEAGTQPVVVHAEHGHVDHGHGHEDSGQVDSGPHFTWQWVITMVVVSVVGGLLIQYAMPATKLDTLNLAGLLEQARPAGTGEASVGRWISWGWPAEHDSHAWQFKFPATMLATGTWVFGIGLAALLYATGYLSAEDIRRQFSSIYALLINKWWFDELYDFVFVQPTLLLSRFVSGVDKNWIDRLLDSLARGVVWISRQWEYCADRVVVDGCVNLFAGWCYSLGVGLHGLQTGRLRQYVMFIVVGAIAIFVLISFFWSPLLAR